MAQGSMRAMTQSMERRSEVFGSAGRQCGVGMRIAVIVCSGFAAALAAATHGVFRAASPAVSCLHILACRSGPALIDD
jgi:hypothetical protein